MAGPNRVQIIPDIHNARPASSKFKIMASVLRIAFYRLHARAHPLGPLGGLLTSLAGVHEIFMHEVQKYIGYPPPRSFT